MTMRSAPCSMQWRCCVRALRRAARFSMELPWYCNGIRSGPCSTPMELSCNCHGIAMVLQWGIRSPTPVGRPWSCHPLNCHIYPMELPGKCFALRAPVGGVPPGGTPPTRARRRRNDAPAAGGAAAATGASAASAAGSVGAPDGRAGPVAKTLATAAATVRRGCAAVDRRFNVAGRQGVPRSARAPRPAPRPRAPPGREGVGGAFRT